MRPPEQTLDVVHETVYRYDRPVARSVHVLRLQPVMDEFQDLDAFTIEVTPAAPIEPFEDVFGNRAIRLRFDEPFAELRIAAASRVRVRAPQVLDPPPGVPPREREVPPVWMPWERQVLQPFLLAPELPETQLRELGEFAAGFARREGHDAERTLDALTAAIHGTFRYAPGATTLATTAWETFAARRGVCQDFATLLVCLARLLDLPARYRVGYVRNGRDSGPAGAADASHAWAEVYLPRTGWRGFDPTNGCRAGADHVRVAAGRHYGDATPTSGTLYPGGIREELTVRARVTSPAGPPSERKP